MVYSFSMQEDTREVKRGRENTQQTTDAGGGLVGIEGEKHQRSNL